MSDGSKGTEVDLNTVMKRIGRLKKFVSKGDITKLKALSTTVLANVNTLNTLIQAATTTMDLSDAPTLPLHDTQDQTSNT
jgi:hypothetical protein